MLWRTFLKSLWQNGKEKSDMLEVKFYDTVDDSLLKFAVIISLSNGKWVFCFPDFCSVPERIYIVLLIYLF